MLRYLGFGRRQFGRFPIKPYARINWEFFAVVRGRCAPQQGEHDRPALRTATLWVTAPGSAHTWAAQGTQTTEVAVFHFGSVPAVLQACVRKHGQLAVPLRAAEARRVAALARSLERRSVWLCLGCRLGLTDAGCVGRRLGIAHARLGGGR